MKKGLRLEHSLCRASRVLCAPSTKRMWFQKHFLKKPLTEPPPGVSALPQPHPRNQGAWPALMVPSHGITAVRLEKPSKVMKSNHQPGTTTTFTTSLWPQVPPPHVVWTLPGTVTPPLPWAAGARAGQPWHNLQKVFIQPKPPLCQLEVVSPRAPWRSLTTHFWVTAQLGFGVGLIGKKKVKIKTTTFFPEK